MSILNVNKINPVGGGSTITIAGIASVTNNISVGNSVTASEFHGSGANLTGLAGGDTALGLNDGVELKLGSSDDLKIWHHSGGNSYIKETGGGSLVINADDFYLQNNATTTFLRTHSSGSIDLNFGGNKKFETTNSGAIVTGIVTATSFVPTEGQLSHRNLIINGAMTIAQRGLTSTSQGYQTVDRFAAYFSGTDEAPTQSTFDVSPPSSPYHLPTSGAHPYKEGFRKAFGVTNGNQTGGAGAGDYVYIRYKVEAKDLANSGWDSTSASSYLTLSFWVKSSVAQNFYCRLESQDGTKRNYPFETGSLSAFTWTKITKTIPGNTSPTVDIDNNNGTGIEIHWQMFRGTDFTDNSVSNDTWATYASGTRTKDATSTWYTTNDASFQITGVQLEVGSVATPFEHKSEQEELLRCYRYYYKMGKLDYKGTHMSANETYGIGMSDNDNTNIYCQIVFPVPMREPPSTLDYASIGNYYVRRDTTQTCTGNPSLTSGSEFSYRVNFPKSSHGWGTGQMLWCMSAGSSSYLGFSAEL